MQALGFLISTLAILTAIGYTIWYFVAPQNFKGAPGFATLVISMWFIGGVQLLFLGLVSEYVYRTFDESRGRPVALVRQVLAHRDLANGDNASCMNPTDNATRNSTTVTGGGAPAKPSSSV
jgi:hypothetical protein